MSTLAVPVLNGVDQKTVQTNGRQMAGNGGALKEMQQNMRRVSTQER
jgi:hypothetical protein